MEIFLQHLNRKAQGQQPLSGYHVDRVTGKQHGEEAGIGTEMILEFSYDVPPKGSHMSKAWFLVVLSRSD